MQYVEKNGIRYLHVPEWSGSTVGLTHGFFLRVGGVSPPPFSSLNLGPFTGDPIRNIEQNLDRICTVLGLPRDGVFAAVQVHGKEIVRLAGDQDRRSIFGSRDPFRCDGFITNQRGAILGILTADCLPVLLHDPASGAVAAVHAGWRGTLQGICRSTLRRLRESYGSRPDDVRVALGPAIGPCCYEVGDDVAEAFSSSDPGTSPFIRSVNPGQWKLDLRGINRYQLCSGGVQEDNIRSTSVCTCCSSHLLYSVRASRGEPTGRQLSVIGLRGDS